MQTSTHDFTDTCVIGTRYLPGLQTDLTGWTLSIDDTGHLIQTLDTFAPVPKRDRRALTLLDQALVLQWIAQADALDFAALRMMEASMSIDDASTYTLLCHFASMQQSITLRTLDWFVRQEQPEMLAFRALWDAIHAVAPFPQTRRGWMASR
jgi:hypothetical protein